MPSARLLPLLLLAASARGTRWETTDRSVWKRVWLTPSKNLELRWAFDKTSGDAKMAVWSSCKGWWGIGIKQKGYGNCVPPIPPCVYLLPIVRTHSYPPQNKTAQHTNLSSTHTHERRTARRKPPRLSPSTNGARPAVTECGGGVGASDELLSCLNGM